MRFLRQSMVGLFLAAAALGLLVVAAQMIAGAVQQRMAQDSKAPPPRERVFAVNVTLAVAEDIAPMLADFLCKTSI